MCLVFFIFLSHIFLSAGRNDDRSPQAFQEISPELPVFNVFDRVAPMSLKIIKDKISDGARQLKKTI